MNPKEARQKLMDRAEKDVKEIREILDAYRIDKGIPVSCFIELISTIAQDYKLIKTYIKS